MASPRGRGEESSFDFDRKIVEERAEEKERTNIQQWLKVFVWRVLPHPKKAWGRAVGEPLQAVGGNQINVLHQITKIKCPKHSLTCARS